MIYVVLILAGYAVCILGVLILAWLDARRHHHNRDVPLEEIAQALTRDGRKILEQERMHED